VNFCFPFALNGSFQRLVLARGPDTCWMNMQDDLCSLCSWNALSFVSNSERCLKQNGQNTVSSFTILMFRTASSNSSGPSVPLN